MCPGLTPASYRCHAQHLFEPMRERRADYLKHPGRIDEIMIAGTEKARLAAKETMLEAQGNGVELF